MLFLEHLSNLWMCPKNCGKGYKYKSHLYRHIAECGVPPRFKCDNCLKPFKRNCDLKRHQVSTCLGNPPAYNCRVCMKKFTYKFNLKTHMILKHNLC